MIRNSSDSFLNKNLCYFKKSHQTSQLILFSLLLINLLFISCSPTKRFTEKEVKKDNTETNESLKYPKEEKSESEINFSKIRVSMQGLIPGESLIIGSRVFIYKDNNRIAFAGEGNLVKCFFMNGQIKLEIGEQEFYGEQFFLVSAESEEIININGKRYRGRIQVSSTNSSISLVNILNLNDYVKGVLAKEMPLGKNVENFEALKALAVCIRTYALQKMNDKKLYFDIYADTRDQVYGGVDVESQVSNKAADETNNLLLKYNGIPATIYYHSTCGGITEAAVNVFTNKEIPYLISIEDGDVPNCKISPRFMWEEKYSKELIVERLKKYSLLDNQYYKLKNFSILSRFESGRVDELEIILTDERDAEKSILIRGNEIRSIIRTADGKNILWSTMFDVSMNSNAITLSGKGFGHGVGLCQWGAIALSNKGWSYEEILNLYYPGTIAEKIND